MNYHLVLKIKKRIEACADLRFQRKVFKTIMKHHPEKPFKTTETSILMHFNNLSTDCYEDLHALTKTILKPRPKTVTFGLKTDETSLLKSHTKEHANYIKSLSNKESQLMFLRKVNRLRDEQSLPPDNADKDGVVRT